MKLTKLLLITGVLLVAYGIVCRLASIYFFWDSRTFGILILLASLLTFLLGQHKKKKLRSQHTMGFKIAIAFVSLLLIGIPVGLAIIMNSEAYKSAIAQIKPNAQIHREVGKIKGFSLINSGSISTTSMNGVEYGEAQFSFTINGDQKYIDVNIELVKQPETDWQIISIDW